MTGSPNRLGRFGLRLCKQGKLLRHAQGNATARGLATSVDSRRGLCKALLVRFRRKLQCLLPSLLVILLLSQSARADLPKEADFRKVTDWLWLLAGAASGLVIHEGGHVVMDLATGSEPELRKVSLGPFPFFAIQPTKVQSPQQVYAISMMGFATQGLYSELILGIDPRLREHHRPFLKGLLGFHVVLSVGYAVTGLAGIGPPQSDVNSMARALQIPSWGTGLLVLVPAVCDLYRYFVPDSRWAPWVSLGGKLTMVGAAAAF